MTSWRVLDFKSYKGSHNMAIDEAVIESVRSGEQPPTLRFYGWKPSCISIGYFQSLELEVDAAACKSAGVDIVRRITGGGAVYHQFEKELTYSLIAPEALVAKDLPESYREICGYVAKGLNGIGIDAQFRPVNDVTADGRKISGSAQTRRGGVVLQHGTVILEVNVDEMFALLKVPIEKTADKFTPSVRSQVTSVKEQCIQRNKPVPSIEAVQQSMILAFMQGKSYFRHGFLSDDELDRAASLQRTKYESNEWNFMR